MEYYTYAYLREDGTPYYIGKGKGRRAFLKHIRQNRTNLKPKDKNKILIKGSYWWNNGQIEKRGVECPDDEWVKGRLKK